MGNLYSGFNTRHNIKQVENNILMMSNEINQYDNIIKSVKQKYINLSNDIYNNTTQISHFKDQNKLLDEKISNINIKFNNIEQKYTDLFKKFNSIDNKFDNYLKYFKIPDSNDNFS